MGVVSVWEIVSQKTDMLERRRPISTTRYHLFMKVLKVQVLSKVQHKIILSGTKNERSFQVIPFFLLLLFYLNKLHFIYLKKYHIHLIQNYEVYVVKNLLSPLCSSHLFLIL